MQTQAKWITELKKTLLNHRKAMKTVQLTSISVSTKGEKQAGTIQLSKCWDDEDQIPKIANLSKTANDLSWCSCLSKFHLTKYGLDSLYILFKLSEYVRIDKSMKSENIIYRQLK